LSIPFFLHNTKRAFVYSIISLVIYVAAVDIVFKICYRVKTGSPYRFIPKVPFKSMYIEPHPYLPFVYKKNFLCQKAMPATYRLNHDKGYIFPQLKTNNFRHINGPKGDRDIEVPKPKDLFRVNCLGASTTGNYIFYNNQSYSYPMELEKLLHNTFPKMNIEVNNCGQGGYTSSGILIKFLLDTIDTEPDVVVIYHAYNDLQVSLTTGYQSDYSHARRNLGEVHYLYRLASKIPNIPLAFWNYTINTSSFSQNIRYTLLSAITREEADIKNNFKGLTTYRRNIEHIINICKANNIQVILSSFCHYLYPEIEKDRTHLKYREGIELENEIMREISRKYSLPLVDNYSLIPMENKYFVDSIHFSPEGMKLLAKNISAPIVEYIKTS